MIPGKPPTTESKLLPFSRIVGQKRLKHALELAFIEPRINGVLISGERGTAKSTAVRAFSQMVFRELPVTLPINATEDRVVGGWSIESLTRDQPVIQPGVLEKAAGKLLYVDEINLLDDHIVNLILDVASTGHLVVQREGISIEDREVHFTLVGTMNPEEGGLRPQLLDRFGLMVEVHAEPELETRKEILRNVLGFAGGLAAAELVEGEPRQDRDRRLILETARAQVASIGLPDIILDRCVKIALAFGAQGHRGEQVMALAARAAAALRLAEARANGAKTVPVLEVSDADVTEVAQLTIQHRRPRALQADGLGWTAADEQLVLAGGGKSPDGSAARLV